MMTFSQNKHRLFLSLPLHFSFSFSPSLAMMRAWLKWQEGNWHSGTMVMTSERTVLPQWQPLSSDLFGQRVVLFISPFALLVHYRTLKNKQAFRDIRGHWLRLRLSNGPPAHVPEGLRLLSGFKLIKQTLCILNKNEKFFATACISIP